MNSANRSETEALETIERHPGNPGLAIARLVPLALWTMICHTANVGLRTIQQTAEGKRAVSLRWTHRWFLGMARLLGFNVRVHGPLPGAGSLIAPNHIGYVDIIALGSVLECFYVAKVDVERWPVIGLVFRKSDHIGVSRRRGAGIAEANDKIAERLRNRESVCVFLEGTSSGGDRILPFHGSHVQPAIDAGAVVVPVGMVWSAARPGINIEEDVAYWKDHVFTRHCWRLLGLRGVEVDIRFGGPVRAAGWDRKGLAATAEQRVAELSGLTRCRA